jgi:hypothetical protein
LPPETRVLYDVANDTLSTKEDRPTETTKTDGEHTMSEIEVENIPKRTKCSPSRPTIISAPEATTESDHEDEEQVEVEEKLQEDQQDDDEEKFEKKEQHEADDSKSTDSWSL